MSKPFAVRLEGNKKYQRLLSGIPQTKGIRAGYVNLKPEEDIGEHSTDSKEEVLIILNGKAEISCGNLSVLLAEADTLIYIPANTKHNVKNIGKALLKYVYITAAVLPTPT